DVFAGTLWPPGSPVSGTVGRLSTAGDRPDRPDSSTLSPDFSRICGGRAELVAWPLDRIREAGQPTQTQQRLVHQVNATSRRAVDALQAGCSTEMPATATGRLDAIANRLQAMLDAVTILRRAFDPFYRALSSEQRARLDRMVAPPRSAETVPGASSAN